MLVWIWSSAKFARLFPLWQVFRRFLSNLSNLILYENQLNGEIPVSLASLTDLVNLHLGTNVFTGAIPVNIGNLTNLLFLNLSNNQLSGEIPTSLGNLGTNLVGLYLYNNQLSGSLPDELGNLVNLNSLWIHENSLSGEIPASITNLNNLYEWDTLLDYNALYTTESSVATFLDSKSPGWLNTQTVAPTNLQASTWDQDITLFWTPIQYQSDSGYYAVEMALAATGPFTQVQTTSSKSDNGTSISGLTLGDTYYFRVRSFTNAWWLDPAELWSDYTEVISTTISGQALNCGLVIEIPENECEALVALYNNTTGPGWTNNTGWLVTSTPCSWFGVGCDGGHVQSLVLDGNQLTGVLPPELGNLVNLSTLHIDKNALSGEIPASITKLANLYDWDTLLGYNALYTTNPTVTAFLNVKDSDWGETQTVTPNDLQSSAISTTKAGLTWIPIQYQSDGGYYAVEMALVATGPFTQVQTTNSKADSGIIIDGLTVGKTYYFRVRTLTDAWWLASAELWSDYTGVISATISENSFDCNFVSELPVNECEALVTLYNNTDGLGWATSTGWLNTFTPCSWFGVGCDGGHVQSLELDGNQLTGVLPPELGNLSYLDTLQLYNNNLSGSIPAEFGNLSHLSYLHLGENQLTGLIPPELGNLSNLSSLYLKENQLAGSIPPELGNLSNLLHLDLSENQLPGSIPSQLGNLSNLLNLNLGGNQLSSPIPAELGNLSHLLNLYLSRNQLSGSIPNELGNLINLSTLHIDKNALSGEIPTSITNLVNLYDWDTLLDYNALYTTNPTLAVFLDAKDPDWEETQTVAPDNLQGSAISTTKVEMNWTPIQYQSDGGYYTVEIASTAAGPFIQVQTTSSKSENETIISGLTVGETYYFRVNTFTNAWWLDPAELWSGYSEVISTTISEDSFNCNFVSELPVNECEVLVTLYNNANGQEWVNSTGWMDTLTPCSWFGVGCDGGHVRSLDMDANNMTGVLPPELGNLSYLNSLSLYNNNLSGSILTEFGNLSTLSYLRIGGNQLAGLIPPELGNLSNLIHLDLSENRLSGSIPTELGNLENLNTLHIDKNALTGEIPTSIINLINLINGETLLSYNALYTKDPSVAIFLDSKSPGWADTQTVAPSNLQASDSNNEAILSWTPITYTSGSGFYEISYASSIGEPYTVMGNTADKTASSIDISSLTPGQTFNFRMRTFSAADWLEPAELWSGYSSIITFTMPSIPQPPSASFSGSIRSGQAPLEVNFMNTSTGIYTNSTWDFGNGFTSIETNPTHTYYLAGTYTVTLTVTGPDGSDSEEKVEYIVVTALAQEEITPQDGGEISYDLPGGGTISIHIPVGAVTEKITIQATSNPTVTLQDGLVLIGESFNLTALFTGLPLGSFTFAEAITIRVDYTDEQIEGIDENSIKLYVWEENSGIWIDAALSDDPPSIYTRNPNENWFSLNTSHLSQFAVFGEIVEEGTKLYLPMISKLKC